MATIGQQFKAARESKGVSEAEAATATNILTKIIHSMEADDFSGIAAPTYAKGFIRLYAKYLELDPEPLVEEYSKKHGTGPRKLIDENSQLEQNTQDSRVFPARSRSARPKGKPPAWLAKLEIIKKLPLGPLKDIRMMAGAIAGLLVLAVIIGSISTCVRRTVPEKTEAPEISPAKMLIDDPLPDLYLTSPDKIESTR
ncbi:helix-turn-helix domain-containing protein [Tichowtungia aerotolerans]|uniref:Helix-turn-helix domain-containing protein n=1 Tax=Tichowtungia aerotolerans TaxID=2697043 RepID=A0A6P1MAR6_9BACT|nr:helix-turn-helix domain-containing protein [Tichowtungia aerotolerans]QHI69188.1 hypothetical protein GT409_06890 [Tichowtungia aerotolerans]